MSTSPLSEAFVREAIAQFPDPETGRGVGTLGQIHQVRLDGHSLRVTLGLTTYTAPIWSETRDKLAALLREKFPQCEVKVELALHDRKPEKMGEIGLTAKSVIAVGAGKGGVGKSSIAAYLACGLARAGCQVGLMDADVYGPSIPHLFGTEERPHLIDERIQPVEVAGLRLMSMGLLVPPGEAVIWRGPMLHKWLTEFLQKTDWGDLDYLIVDMPPGTGDVALSLAHLLPVSAAVVVCTPQDVALLDVTKAVAMFRKVDIEVLGMVENMSFFICPSCQSRHDIFGSGGARQKAAELNVPFLGEVPIHIPLRILADEGQVARSLDDPAAQPYLNAICLNLVRNLAAKHCRQPELPPLTVLG